MKTASASKRERPPYFVISVQPCSDQEGDANNNNNNRVPTKSANGNNNNNNNNNDTVHVLVMAHPDDESMFFLPTIRSLQEAGETVWILCLTTGNYDGLGNTRKLELSNVCRLLGIPKLIQVEMNPKNSTDTDNDGDDDDDDDDNDEGGNHHSNSERSTRSSTLQDHPTEAWSLDVVSAELEKVLSVALRSTTSTTTPSDSSSKSVPCAFKRVVLITFDMDGVSGHVNHRDTYLGVRNLVLQQQRQRFHLGAQHRSSKRSGLLLLPPLEAWKLDTVHFLPVKYLPVAGWCLYLMSLCRLWKPTCSPLPRQPQQHYLPFTNDASNTAFDNTNFDANNTMEHTYRSADPMLSWKAMATHQSQFVWYRRLFVVFSCYTFVNKLRPVQ